MTSNEQHSTESTPASLDPSSAVSRGNRVRYLREDLLKLSREKFSDGTEFTSQSLKGWEQAWGGGLTEKGAGKITQRAKELGIYCSAPWLMHGIGIPATKYHAGFDVVEDDEEIQIQKELVVFREQPNSIDAIIRDDTMAPLFPPDTVVGGIIMNDISKAIGRECIILTATSEVYVRTLEVGQDENHFNLTCYNKNTLMSKHTIVNIEIMKAAPIIWIRRKKPK